MKSVSVDELQEGDVVYYIPSHLEKKPENAEHGVITSIKDNNIWVRYKGPQGNLTPVKNLYK